MARESLTHSRRDYDELKTIQIVEETIGPKGLRDLRHAFPDEGARRLLEAVARESSDDLRELDDVLHEWSRVEGPPPPPRVAPDAGLDRDEVLSSIVELKQSEAQLMRRAAAKAPNAALRDRLLALADRHDAAAERLRGLL